MDVPQQIQDKIIKSINSTYADPDESHQELYFNGYRAGKTTLAKKVLNAITDESSEFVGKIDRTFYILQMAEIDHVTIPNGTHMGVVMEYDGEDYEYVAIPEHRERVLNYMNKRGVIETPDGEENE